MRWAAISLVLVTAAVVHGADARYVAAREVVLAYATANDAPVEVVELWVTRDAGKNWRQEPAEQCGRRSVCFKAPEDGWYGFYLILHNGAGASTEPPASGAEPHTRVIVDTVAPVLQLHRGTEPLRAVPGHALDLRISLIDEHLGHRPVRVFYRSSVDAPWRDGGCANLDGLELTWPVPTELAGGVDLRIVATDLAGNRTFEDLSDVAVDTPEPPAAADQPVNEPPVTVAASQPIRPEPRHYAVGELDQLNELRNKAARQRAAGLQTQAIETFQNAVQICPDDPDLLSGLGEALYSAGRPDEAERSFSAAVASSPDHPRALEGLALVAATQKRYPQAAAHLEHKLRLEPESAQTWLHYGDVENKLGERAKALQAWERVVSLREADPTVRESAERRLKYFGPPPRVRP